jgi:hypothetical protein
MRHENPKHKQGDGAGFGRLRAEQEKRTTVIRMLVRAHPDGSVYVDQIREYAGAQIVFFRHTLNGTCYARVAVARVAANGNHYIENDIIAIIEGEK